MSEQTIELTTEEYSAMQRQIQIGAPDEMLPIGITVGAYREQVKEAERAESRGDAEEAESTRRQAATPHDAVRVTLADDGRIVGSPVLKAAEPSDAAPVDALRQEHGLSPSEDVQPVVSADLIPGTLEATTESSQGRVRRPKPPTPAE